MNLNNLSAQGALKELTGVRNLKFEKDLGSGSIWECDGLTYGFFKCSPQKLERATFDIYELIFSEFKDLEIYRFWNFIPKINQSFFGIENYKRFNAGRRKAVEKFDIEVMPAATAIDILGDELIIIFVAGKTKANLMDNPEQTIPKYYPKKYGKSSPNFSRATFGDQKYYISGTASIKGSETLFLGDISMQTEVMFDNLDIMMGQKPDLKLKSGVVYVRHKADIKLIKEKFNYKFPNTTFLFLQANVCRKNLLVEAELILE